MAKHYSRREFLKTASLTAAGAAFGVTAFSAKSYSRILGANERVNFAVIGLHGRGNAHISALAACQNAMVTTICDVARRELDRVAPNVLASFGQAPVVEKDFRKVLESKAVDAITIATPEHWHAPMAIAGVQAGKHVYLEKPGSHNPAEGEMLVKAQKKTGKLIQFGDQQRSSTHTIEAIRKIREGVIGRVYVGAGPMTNAHFQNFIDAIRTGEELHSPIHEGNVSATLLHLSNLAWKFGRQLRIDPKTAHVVNDKEAMKCGAGNMSRAGNRKYSITTKMTFVVDPSGAVPKGTTTKFIFIWMGAKWT
jgi:hypothetical protein